jgi:hypothetical protein
MGKSYLCHLGEWVRVANMRNKQFPRARGPCVGCGYLTAGTVYYSIKTHEVRCLRCFAKTEAEHRRQVDEREWCEFMGTLK